MAPDTEYIFTKKMILGKIYGIMYIQKSKLQVCERRKLYVSYGKTTGKAPVQGRISYGQGTLPCCQKPCQ